MKRINLIAPTLGIVVLLFWACNGTLVAQCSAPAPVPSLLLVETTGQLQTTGSGFVPITGLEFTLPCAVPATPSQVIAAVVTLDVPNPYATGTDTPGGCFAVFVNDQMINVPACFTYDATIPEHFGRKPTTLVVKINLPTSGPPLTIKGEWQALRGSVVNMDTTSTLSAVIAPVCTACTQ